MPASVTHWTSAKNAFSYSENVRRPSSTSSTWNGVDCRRISSTIPTGTFTQSLPAGAVAVPGREASPPELQAVKPSARQTATRNLALRIAASGDAKTVVVQSGKDSQPSCRHRAHLLASCTGGGREHSSCSAQCCQRWNTNLLVPLYRERSRGSSVSRRASPKMLNPKTASAMQTPGQMARPAWRRMYSRPSIESI